MDKTDWKLYGALYGNESPPTQAEIDAALKRRQGRSLAHSIGDPESEATAQAKLVAYLRRNNILFYHVPNGGYREKREAWALKGQGVQPGVPDIVIPIARKPYHGLYIELKRQSGGVISSAQEWWLKQLVMQNYRAKVAKGFEEALREVLNYLSLPKWEPINEF
jgi:hypothetical protein